MKDFNRISKILLKRNGFWLGLLFLVIIINSFFSVKTDIKTITRQIGRPLIALEQVLEDQINYDFYETYEEQLRKKYPDKLPANIYEEYDAYYEQAIEAYKKINADRDKYKQGEKIWLEERIRELEDRIGVYEGLFRENDFRNEELGIVKGKISLGKRIENSITGAMIFSAVLGILFTSMEHLTPYYDFTRMFPWSSSKTYLYKLGLGIIITSLVNLVFIAMTAFMWNTSYLSELLLNTDLVSSIFHSLARNAMFYTAIVALGTVAGNIFGHIGMLIIGLLGPFLLKSDYAMMRDILGLSLSSSAPILKFVESIRHTIFYPLYSPMESFFSNERLMTIGLVLYTIIIFGLGLYWSKTAKAERTGMLVLKKGLSNYAFFLAVVTTLGFVGQMNLYVFEISRPVSLIIHLILGYVIYRFYKILFNIKIGV
ncbi:MAG: hypothetical protein Q4E36_00455 [Bacillota bacterium]|nr:hypothetical protein [Bacillota bacterium]